MNSFQIIAILITLAAAFAFINYRLFKMPMTIGLMVMSLFLSLLLIVLHRGFGIELDIHIQQIVSSINFSEILFQGMLGGLLFAGSLHVNLDDLHAHKLDIIILSTLSVVASTFLVGTAIYFLTSLLGIVLGYLDCLLFGALISPTDPIAVLAIMRKAGAPKDIETKIAGESLFNDGMGVVIFLILLRIATGQGDASVNHIALLFLEEAGGGILFGLIVGYGAYLALRRVDDYQVEVMVTLALVLGGYAVASAIGVSGPIAMVTAGILIGNHGRRLAMSETTRTHLDSFWELIDTILNAVLFVLIGLEVMVLDITGSYLIAGALAIPVALFARFLSVGVPVSLLKPFRRYSEKTIRIMTWGGLRGGISVALALSLPDYNHRELILTMTYMIVIFSVVVQGLTIKSLVKSVARQPLKGE